MKFNVDDLVAKKLVTKKTYTEGPFAGLSVLKYKNNVFWDNLWHTDARLLECRGMVVDAEDNVVIWPFTKIFNRFENGTDLPLDKEVVCTRKVNGFMAAATVHKGEVLVSTTGTLDSEFSVLAKKHILDSVSNSGHQSFWTSIEGCGLTLIFEICDNSDPHIVHENSGAYLIGGRLVGDQVVFMLSEHALDQVSRFSGLKRPEWSIGSFGDVVISSKSANHEGFVVRDPVTGELLLKIKSPHYLAKKFLMRGSENKWDMLWDNPKAAKQRVEEEFYDLLDWIRLTYLKDYWSVMSSQQRRVIVEYYFSKKESVQ